MTPRVELVHHRHQILLPPERVPQLCPLPCRKANGCFSIYHTDPGRKPWLGRLKIWARTHFVPLRDRFCPAFDVSGLLLATAIITTEVRATAACAD